MKYILSIIAFITVPCTLTGQTLADDFFPLAVGNQWSYDYYTEDWDQLGDFWMSDSGTAIYRVVSKSAKIDSTIWDILEIRDVQHSYASMYPPQFDTTYRLRDSTAFQLIEFQAGDHRLVSTAISWQSVFCFNSEMADSNLLFRYYPSPTPDTLNLIFADMFQGRLARRFDASFQRQIGLIRGAFSAFFTGDVPQSRHSLQSALILSVDPSRHAYAPKEFILHQNYPNPFNPATDILIDVSTRSNLQLQIFDVLGQLIETIFEGQVRPGNYRIHWNAVAHASGMYLCVARTLNQMSSIRLVHLK